MRMGTLAVCLFWLLLHRVRPEQPDREQGAQAEGGAEPPEGAGVLGGAGAPEGEVGTGAPGGAGAGAKWFRSRRSAGLQVQFLGQDMEEVGG